MVFLLDVAFSYSSIWQLTGCLWAFHDSRKWLERCLPEQPKTDEGDNRPDSSPPAIVQQTTTERDTESSGGRWRPEATERGGAALAEATPKPEAPGGGLAESTGGTAAIICWEERVRADVRCLGGELALPGFNLPPGQPPWGCMGDWKASGDGLLPARGGFTHAIPSGFQEKFDLRRW